MQDCVPKQPPRSDQEHDGEHQQAWNEQKCSASQVVYHLNKLKVLPWNMVDNSSSPLQTHFGSVFRDEAVQRGLLFLEPGSIRVFLRAPSPISP
jgi:hypothetical protein